MTDLIPLTALGANEPWEETYGSLTLRENTGLALASLSLNPSFEAPQPFGLPLPDVGTATRTAEFGAFWTAPHQWMIEGYGQAETDFAAAVKDQAPRAYVTEQTDGWCVFDIADQSDGTQLERFLTRLVNIDPAKLAQNMAVRTGLDHMSVFLIRRSPQNLTILAMRSFANSLMHALSTTAQRLEMAHNREST